MGGCFVLQIKPHHVKRAPKYASVKMSLSSVAGAMSNLKGIYNVFAGLSFSLGVKVWFLYVLMLAVCPLCLFTAHPLLSTYLSLARPLK